MAGGAGRGAGREPWKMAEKASAEAHAKVQEWRNDLQGDRERARERNAMVRAGGKDMQGREWEGRRVGIDFYTSPRGPPGNLKDRHDVRGHGKQGLAPAYAGDREKENPWQWDCQWQEMGIPAETKRALAREKKMGKGGRIVYDMGIYPAARKEALDREAEFRQKDANLERGKLYEAWMKQAVLFEAMRDHVFQGRIKWERRNGRWLVAGDLGGDDLVILAADRGAELLNQTPFNFDRPEGPHRPQRLHEMLSQLIRAPTIRDLSQIPPPHAPYAWPAEQPAHVSGTAAPPRQEWDIRSLMRGERRTVVEKRNASHARSASAGAHRSEEEREGEEGEAVQTLLLEGTRGHVPEHAFKVFHPGGKKWDGVSWREVPPAIITVRHYPNRHLGLNRQLLAPSLPQRAPELEGLSPSEVELHLRPSTKEIQVFHHMAALVPGAKFVRDGEEVCVWHGGSGLPPDRRQGIVEAENILGDRKSVV